MIRYKNQKLPQSKSLALRWRFVVTTHEGHIDRPKNADAPEKGWREKGGKDLIGTPWVDAKTLAVSRVIDDHLNAKGECWLSYASMAEQARLTRRSVIHAVDRLIGAGLLRRKRRKVAKEWNDTSVLTVILPPWSDPREDGTAPSQASSGGACSVCGSPARPGMALCQAHYLEWSGQ